MQLTHISKGIFRSEFLNSIKTQSLNFFVLLKYSQFFQNFGRKNYYINTILVNNFKIKKSARKTAADYLMRNI